MAFQYFLYRTDLNNTLVDRSNTTFAPLPPNTGEIFIDFMIPKTQPLYFYRESSGLIVLNSQENIDEYLEETNPLEPDDFVTQNQFTGYTETIAPNTFLKLDQTTPQIVSGGTPQFEGIKFNTNIISTPNIGELNWNDDDGALEYGVTDEVVLQIGQENLVRVRNNSGELIPNGSIVSPIGVFNNRPSIGLLDATVSPRALGLTTTDILNNEDGYVTVFGLVRNLNTSAFTEGTTLYVSITPGEFTDVIPPPPYYNIPIGIVIRQHIDDGIVFINPKFAYNLQDLSNVCTTGGTIQGDFPVFDDDCFKFDNVNNYLLKQTFENFTGGTDLQTVTSVGATTDVESTFSSGLITNTIKAVQDSTSAIQLSSNDGTPVISVDTISGFTGFGIVEPEYLIHVFGTDTRDDDPIGIQRNGINIDGVAAADKDIAWLENGVPQWLAETYRNEAGEFWYLYNVQAENEILSISEGGRLGVNSQTNIMSPHAIFGSTGSTSGLNDLKVSGLYERTFVSIFYVQIADTSGGVDTFNWFVSYNDDQNFTLGGFGVQCSTEPIELESGVFITFDNLTGHVVGDYWGFAGFPQLPRGTFEVFPHEVDEVHITSDYTGSITYTELSANANTTQQDSYFTVLNTGNTLGALYVGTKTQLNGLFFNFLNGGSDITLVVEYWNGSSWIDISIGNINFIDTTNNFSKTGEIIWDTGDMTGWTRDNIQDLPGDEHFQYWLRFRSSSNPTTIPTVVSIARGSGRRLGVYSSPFDINPVFFVDSLGRTNIGGGNVTGTNVLQINTESNTPTEVGIKDSLVEIDSNNPDVVDLKIKLSANDERSGGLTFAKTRGSLASPQDLEFNDQIGHVDFRAQVDGSGGSFACVHSQYKGNGITCFADLIFSTASGAASSEKVRVSNLGTGFGVSEPDATIHIKAGTTSQAPIKLTSGGLLTTPQAGAIEFNGEKYFATTGSTRHTIAFLESPEFTGSPNLPINTTLNNINLNDYILNSGGTNNPLLTQKSDFDTFTGATVPWEKVDKTGSDLADLETRNAGDVDLIITSWDSTNIGDISTKLSKFLEDTHGTGRLAPEEVLFGVFTQTLSVSGGTGYINYPGFHKYITWDGQQFDVSTGYTVGVHWVYVDSNGDIQISDSDPGSTQVIRLGIFYWGGTIIGVIQNCGCVLENSTSRLIEHTLRQGIFIYDNGGNVNVLSGNDLKIISTPCKVQFGLLDTQLTEITSNDAVTTKFSNFYLSNDLGWQVNYDFINTEGIVRTDRWNDITQDSFVVFSGFNTTFTNGSNVVTADADLTTFGLEDAFIYDLDDGQTFMNPVSAVTWTGSETEITLERPYQGSSGVGILVANYALPKLSGDTYVKHLIVRSADDRMFLFYAQTFFNVEALALAAPSPAIPEELQSSAIKMATIVVGNGDTSLIGKIFDVRPLPYQFREGGQAGGGASITNHGDLSGLGNDDHLQYLRVDGARAATGILSYASAPTFTQNNNIVSKLYVDDGLNLKVDTTTFNTFTNTTLPANYYNKTEINSYTGATATAINNRLLISDFNVYSGNTLSNIQSRLLTTTFNTFTGTTLPANYVQTTLFNTYTGDTLTALNLKANLASPNFTGVPTAPTAAVNTSTTQIATTAYVVGQASTVNPLMNGITAIGTSLRYSREDHIHPSDTSKLNVAGGTITGSLTVNTNLTVLGTSDLDTVLVDDGLAKYKADYSEDFDERTLVDKEYVDNAVQSLTFLDTTSAGATTTTSTAYVLQTGMIINNVPAGTYLLNYGNWLSHGSNNGTIYTSIFVGGTAVGGSEMQWNRPNQSITATHVYAGFPITLAATANVEIRWRTDNGTATSTNRYITLLRVG